ncbi:MAG: sugar ABC transporter ATP-binding protein [Chloroflexi bacterium]|nr:sugar ABC transporter ATP-binding protein [Chloroflexota bacterium]MYF22676.1 sugar ABC transporter ATP-binding protein [Chloroflexota bacterium]
MSETTDTPGVSDTSDANELNAQSDEASAPRAEEAGAESSEPPVLEVRGLGRRFGSVLALEDVNVSLHASEVTCVVGDNGAGKSVFIKMLCGLIAPSSGEILLDGDPTEFSSPRQARSQGIVAVYQDLALAPLMSLWRNFFMGAEPVKGWGIFQRFDVAFAKQAMQAELEKLGVDLGDPDRAAHTLSGGERQGLAIARALYYGARVLILDEPTSALGVRQSGAVLRLIRRAAQRGTAVVLVTPKPQHAFWVGDRFLVFQRGRLVEDRKSETLTLESLSYLMAGGTEVEELETAIATA